MNGAHLHLIVNHISLFALVVGIMALILSMKRQSADLRLFASVLFVIVGIFGWVAFETGEKAEELLKAIGVNAGSFLDEHAMAAIWAERSSLLIGSLTLVMEWAAFKKKSWLKILQWILLFFALHGLTVFATTAFLGGKIMHTEIRD